MVRGKKKSESAKTSAVEEVKATPAPLPGLPTPKPAPRPLVSDVAPVVRKKASDGEDQRVMTFKRWFGLLGRPPHHKMGMQAFANTKGKRSMAAWNRLFAAY